MRRRRQLDHQSRVLHDLSSLLLDLLRPPPSPIDLFTGNLSPPPAPPSPSLTTRRQRLPPITPAGFASLLLGISIALMFCGSLTFFIGFMLIPWVFGLFMLLYFVGFLSALSLLARSILYYATSATAKLSSLPPPSSSPPKDIPAWKLL